MRYNKVYSILHLLLSNFLSALQAKLIRLFSRMLIAKSKLRLHDHISQLEAFPNTDQWLQIVGFTDSALRVCMTLLSEILTRSPCKLCLFSLNLQYCRSFLCGSVSVKCCQTYACGDV